MFISIARNLSTESMLTLSLHAENVQDRMVLAAVTSITRTGNTVHVYTEGETVICASTTRTDGQVMVGPEGEPPSFMIIGF